MPLTLHAPKKIPAWLPELVLGLIRTAEAIFSRKPKSGPAKKRFVLKTIRATATDLLASVDLPGVEGDLEDALKEEFLDLLIEIVWAIELSSARKD